VHLEDKIACPFGDIEIEVDPRLLIGRDVGQSK
jgi:hypothetical protein